MYLVKATHEDMHGEQLVLLFRPEGMPSSGIPVQLRCEYDECSLYGPISRLVGSETQFGIFKKVADARAAGYEPVYCFTAANWGEITKIYVDVIKA